jgi:glycosyltransferase involved in cell wall biosynthesis
MTLVGSKPPESALALAGKDSRFRVTGFVEDVRPHMREACFFVCPIRDGGGTKLKILNAMAMGKAVIADEVASEGIDAEPGKDLMLASSGSEYVSAIEQLLDDAQHYEALARSARSVIERQYSYAAIGAELGRQYESVVADAASTDGSR